MKKLGILVLVCVAALAALAILKWIREPAKIDAGIILDVSAHAKAAHGTLIVSVYGDRAGELSPLTHRTTYVNGPDYAGMEDNDLRGFLDGFYKYDWNSPTQIHVRMGRRARAPRHGELEIFRIAHRWDDIELPAASAINAAQIDFLVEYGPPYPVDVFLYEVKKDWSPGEGGVERNNVSTRSSGEAWWLDTAYEKESWGLPGAGFASDTHPDADTGAMPLASASYAPGNPAIHFSSPELTRYISERISAHEPLRFLMKLSDDHEDSPGSVLGVYSGNHGDTRNIERRPRLLIEWHNPTEIRHLEKRVLLEHGRSIALEPLAIDGARFVSISFEPEEDFERPTIEIRNGDKRESSDWRKTTSPLRVNGKELDIRLRAARDIVELGRAFESQLRDTWVISGTPEAQVVPWHFESPSGRETVVNAEYQGDYRWTVRFLPKEIGRWRYWWTQEFAKNPYKSTDGFFDVLGSDAEGLHHSLVALRNRIRDSALSTAERHREFQIEFIKLERAVMQAQTPESYESKSGREIRALLREIRVELAKGKKTPVPML